jgi:membrane-bound lytic murein transglycosylase D
MQHRGWGAKLTLYLGLALFISSCATSPKEDLLPRLADRGAAPGLIPQEYLCPGGVPQEGLDPELAKEIRGFLGDSGFFAGLPDAKASELPIVLNGPVQFYLRQFSTSQKNTFKVYLSRSSRYLPMMRRIFQEHGLPQDLVYLALVESGFSPWARSPAEAIGIWQFIRGTGERYGLKVNDWVDERRDPVKSTRAAARYLKDLFRQFGSWYLAAAGYNAGERRVESALNRHASQSFWDLAQIKALPQETCNYVPQFVAAALIAKNPKKFGFQKIGYLNPSHHERVKIPGGVDLRWFAQAMGVPYEDLKELNPELRKDCTPFDCQEYSLRIPARQQRQAIQLAQICWKEKE